MPDENTLGDQFEALIAAGQMTFRPARLEELDDWGRALVTTFLPPEAGISWKLGTPRIGNAYCLRLNDRFLHYLDVYPDTEQFQWCGAGHHEGIHPDEALAYLMARAYPDLHIQVLRDEQTGRCRLRLESQGRVVRIEDLRNLKPGSGAEP